MTSSPCRNAPGAPWRAAALAALSLAACAGAQRKPDAPQWPLPPDPPRVKWVRSFSTAQDLEKSGLKTALRAIVPTDTNLAVQQPTALALSTDDRILYVACAAARVLAVDLVSGTMRSFADVEGKSPARPFGVAVDGEDNVYVTDSSASFVWVYARDGRFLRRFGQDKLERPAGIAIDRRRQLAYVVAGTGSASQHHRVEVFSLAGEHLRTIGTRGNGPGDFNFPNHAAVAKDGTLYVVDMLNFRVQVFDPDGQLLGMFGTIGSGQPNTFDKAKGIALDAFGNIYVADSNQGYVQIFNPQLRSLMAFSGRANAPGYMMLPTAIAITARNTIYVADFVASTVNEFLLFNTTAEDSSLDAAGAQQQATPSAAGSQPETGGASPKR